MAPRTGDPVERFIKKFEITPEGCWEWTACRHPSGYGKFFLYKNPSGTPVLAYAHRYAYETFVEPVPEGLQLDHLCRVRYCVNPDHLEVVTARENVARIPEALRARPRALAETCHLGHPYDDANTYVSPKGKRNCRACHRDSSARARSAA